MREREPRGGIRGWREYGMHLICNCQSGTVEESAGTWMFATSGSAGPCRADKLSKIFFFLDRERVQGVPKLTRAGEGRNIRVKRWFTPPWRRQPRGGFTWGLNPFPRGEESGYEGGWQLGQLVIRDWSRFFLHLLLSWRMCNFLGCAGRRELCFHY